MLQVGTITVDADGSYTETDEHGGRKKLTKAKITLNDCLACRCENWVNIMNTQLISGCVTTAETILIQQQSHEEFLTRLKDEEKTKIVSISPQSRTSLAAHFSISSLQVLIHLD